MATDPDQYTQIACEITDGVATITPAQLTVPGKEILLRLTTKRGADSFQGVWSM